MSAKLGRIWAWSRKNPFACAVFVCGAAAGSAAAVWFQIGPEEMAAWKRAVGGAFVGLWLAMFPLGSKLFSE